MNKILQGDCLIKLKELEDNSVDSIVTDPPYGLGFMGKEWDTFDKSQFGKAGEEGENDLKVKKNFNILPRYNTDGLYEFSREWAKECFRVLKPGGYLLSFAGTRTYHKITMGIEDAGFEVRDMIEWVYGSGFPKSLNIGKAVDKLQGNEREDLGPRTDIHSHGTNCRKTDVIYPTKEPRATKGTSEWEGWGTALKPAHEPICMARKPLAEKTVAENVLKYGTGGINIDVSRVSTDAYKDDDSNESIVPSHKLSELRGKLYTLLSSCVADKTDFPPFPNDGEYALRWKELSDFLCGCQFCYDLYDGLLPLFQEGDRVSFQQLHDVQDGISRLHKEPSNNHGVCIFRPSTEDVLSQLKSYSNDTKLDIQSQGRFPANLCHDNSEEVRECFPETKTGAVKNAVDNGANQPINLGGGLTKERLADSGNASRFFKSIIYQAKSSKSERTSGGTITNSHPTIKPIALMEYLIKMVTPKGGIVLDPFAGSGSTLVAAKQNGFQYVGIEMTEEYIPIIEARLNYTPKTLF